MEQDEFTTVYRQFYRPLYVYALSLSGNRSDAEDLVQSTFLKPLCLMREAEVCVTGLPRY